MNSLELCLRSTAYRLMCRREKRGHWKRHQRELGRWLHRLDTEQKGRLGRERLRSVIEHARATCAYYDRAWRNADLEVLSTGAISSLSKLPFIEKKTIRESANEMISSRFSVGDLIRSQTGGTTGPPTRFYLDRECGSIRFGRQWGILEASGYKPGMRRGLVWGAHLDLGESDSTMTVKSRLRKFASGDEVLCSTRLTNDSMREFHSRLVRFKPAVLYGYPNALIQFAQFVRERRLPPISVKRTYTTAERLTESGRRTLLEEFGGEVFNLYCTREYGCVAFECTEHVGLHVDTGSVALEIVRNGIPAAPGEFGEIVITDLNNYGMPFIRSRTGDFAAMTNSECRCGLTGPRLLEFDGRQIDGILDAENRLVPGLMLTDLFAGIPEILTVQFVQESVGSLRVCAIVDAQFTAELQEQAIAETRRLLGAEMKISFEQVHDLPRDARSGKVREVVSLVSEESTVSVN